MIKKLLLLAVLALGMQMTFAQRNMALKPVEGTAIKNVRKKVDRSSLVKNISCIDTVRYPLLKEQLLTTALDPQFYTFSVWAADIEAFSQAFTFSGTGLTITGVEFFGANFIDALNGLGTASITVRARIMAVNGTNNPTATVLASGTTTITSTTADYYYVNFGTPAIPTGNYAVVIDVTSGNGILDLYVTDAYSGQPQDENLSRFNSLYYPNSGGTWVSIPVLTSGDPTNFPSDGVAPDPAYDFEPIVAPIVSYSITSSATVSPDPVCLGTAQTFTGTATPTNILSNRMYNYQKFEQYFFGGADSTYVWDTADPAPLFWSSNMTYTYPTAGNYSPTFYVLGGFWNSCLDSATDPIVVAAPSTAPTSISGTLSLCGNGSTTLTALGGTTASGGTYQWGTGSTPGSNVIPGETGETYTTPVLTTTTSYWVRRIDVAPCNNPTNAATATVTVTPVPNITVSSNVPNSCDGATVSLTAAGGTSYSWTTGATSSSEQVNPTVQTTYTVTGTTSGCTNTASITIGAFTSSNASFTYPTNTICSSAGSQTPSVVTVGGTFSSTGGLVVSSTTGVIDVAASPIGTYIVYYDFGGNCPSQATQSVTITDAPVATFSYTSPSYCTSATDPIPNFISGASAGVFSSTPSGLSLNTGSGILDLSASTAGVYTVTNDINIPGCAPASASVIIEIFASPSVTIVPVTPLCSNSNSVNLTATPIGGTFSGTGVSSNVFNPTVSGAGNWIVTYTYTNADNCTGTNTTSITVNAVPSPVFASLPSQVCASSSAVALNATPTGGTFSGTGVSGSSFNPAQATTGVNVISYSVTQNGCTGTNTASITVVANPTVSITPMNQLCSNDGPVTLSATPTGGTFTGNGVSGGQFTPSQAGNTIITYVFTDGNGCSGGSSITVTVAEAPVVTLGALNAICLQNGSVTLTGGLPNGGDYSGPGISNNTFDPTVTGVGSFNVDYTYTNASGCTDAASSSITVNDCAGIEEDNSYNLIISPNPAEQSFVISMDDLYAMNVSYALFSEDGKQVVNPTAISTAETTVNTMYYANGIYFIHLMIEDKTIVRKIVIRN